MSTFQDALKAYRAGKHDAALELLDRLAFSVKATDEAVFLRGLVLLKKKDFLSSARQFARIELGRPLGAAAAYNLALAWVSAGRKDKATDVVSAVVRGRVGLSAARREPVAAALYNVGVALWAKGYAGEALGVFRQVVRAYKGTRAHPLAAKVLKSPLAKPEKVTLSRCANLYAKADYRAAESCFRALVRTRGPDPQILFALGYARYQMRRYRGALDAFDQALLLSPFDGDTVFMKAMASMRLGRYESAAGLFLQALKLGLSQEEPSEARRYVRLLKKYLKRRPATGWHFKVQVGGGYDSHPRLAGVAADAGSSQWSSTEGSGFASLEMRVGHAFGRAEPFRADVYYEFSQILMFSDFRTRVQRQGGPWGGDAASGLSFQTHGLAAEFLLRFKQLGLKLGLGGFAELAGLSDIMLVDLGSVVEPRLDFRWNAYTTTEIGLRWTAQKASADEFAYLTGHGLAFTVSQSVNWQAFIRVVPAYTVSYWWLGKIVTDPSDCVADEPCVLSAPYSFLAHKGSVSLESEPVGWLWLKVGAAIRYQRFSGLAVYRQTGIGDVSRRRKDLMQAYDAVLGFKLFRSGRLDLRYGFAHNTSTINAETVGLEEGYDRHVVEVRFRYAI